jgi:hypothetical protein
MRSSQLLPTDWDPRAAGSAVLDRLVTVTAPEVKGAHDAEMVLSGNHAYIVAEVNDRRAGESAAWPEIYTVLSIVNLELLVVEAILPFARSEQVYDNETLPKGQCFVPRIVRKDTQTLRCYFASQDPGHREAQIWHIDFDLLTRIFDRRIFKTRLKTSRGVFDMQPRHFHADAVKLGFRRPVADHGLYLFNSFKVFDGRVYVAVNNFPGRQNALAVANAALDTFEIVGHYNEPQDVGLSESAVTRLPDGSWMAICRADDAADRNYRFTTSRDGVRWTSAVPRPCVPSGTNAKPTLDRFGDLYMMGWQEATTVRGVARSVFNLDVSRDCVNWERKYRFETDRSFQYPTFREHQGVIYVSATQGEPGRGGKTHIRFGVLERLDRPTDG